MKKTITKKGWIALKQDREGFTMMDYEGCGHPKIYLQKTKPKVFDDKGKELYVVRVIVSYANRG